MIKNYLGFLNKIEKIEKLRINENYLSIRDELFTFFSGIGIDIMIYVEDRQSYIVEFDFNITKKEEWYEDFLEICQKWEYEGFVEGNKAFLSTIFGVIYSPEEYNQFDD